MTVKEYLSERITMANPSQLVEILYEGLAESLKDARQFLANDESVEFDFEIEKTREILSLLIATIKGNSDIANNLRSLYVFINQLVTEAVNTKSVKGIDDAIRITKPLFEAWKELANRTISEEQSLEKVAVIAGMTYGKTNINTHVITNKKRWENG
ncbi:MAG: flagellar protein FliS [Clostridiales bacterium]|nr:flagellar protein FliS [Clostridiales bacterium]